MIAVVDGLVILVVLLAVLAPLVLYVLIRAETSTPTVVDRREAEREAKAQGGLRDRSRDQESRTDERDGGEVSTDGDALADDREPDHDRNWWDEG